MFNMEISETPSAQKAAEGGEEGEGHAKLEDMVSFPARLSKMHASYITILCNFFTNCRSANWLAH